jgi:hypothetical protein
LNFSYEEKDKEKKGNMIFFDKMGEIKKIQKKRFNRNTNYCKRKSFFLGGAETGSWLTPENNNETKEERSWQPIIALTCLKF